MSVVGLEVRYVIGGPGGQTSLEQLAIGFERAGAEVADFSTHIFPKLSAVFEAGVLRQFEARGGGPRGGPWAPLSEAYGRWKAKHYPGKPLLERTGDLKAALTKATDAKAWREWSASMFSFGTVGLEYASFHQTGTGRMPARPEFDFDDQFEAELQRAALQGVREAVRDSGLGIDVTGGP